MCGLDGFSEGMGGVEMGWGRGTFGIDVGAFAEEEVD